MKKYVQFELSEDWYFSRYGVSFKEDFWVDPIKRTETYRELSNEVNKRFEGLEMGSNVPNPVVSDQYGHRFVPKLFGCNVVYNENQAPAAVALDLDMDELAKLDIPDLYKNDVFKKAMDDAKRMKEKYGFAHSGINMGSPLNVAVTAFGEEFIASCICEPEIAQHVLMIICKTMNRLMYEFENAINPGGRIDRINGGIGNCPAIMFSPEVYREVILPVDLWYRQQFKDFGIHHCGKFDKYNELYKALRPTGFDIGGGSDYALMRKHYPKTMCSFIVNPELYEGKETSDIDALVYEIVTKGGPQEFISHLHTYGVGRNATDKNITDLRTSIERQFKTE